MAVTTEEAEHPQEARPVLTGAQSVKQDFHRARQPLVANKPCRGHQGHRAVMCVDRLETAGDKQCFPCRSAHRTDVGFHNVFQLCLPARLQMFMGTRLKLRYPIMYPF